MTIGTGATATSDSRWSERNIRYDLEGNILHLERYQGNANTPQATLDFSYDGPKRNGYSYDSNGNITYDPLRCFEIRYNLLNLAAEVIGHDPEDTAAEGTLLCETVYYADGTRSGVRRPNDGPWLTRYVSSLICDGDSEFLYPMGVVSDFGYIDLQSGKMQYFLRDHLGSVRVIAEDRHTVISRTDYLPFGVRMSGDGLTGANSTARSSFFGFSGKENEMWGGYDTADGDITPHWLKGERYQHFGARAYDPVSCIFMQVDPMAEKYYGMTPYGYCAGNPVMMVDPDGEIPFIANLVAGVISASIDFGAQVVVKMADSNDFSFDSFVKAVKDVDYLDVVISGIEGALTMGASNAKKFAVKGAAIVASSVVDVKINDGVTINDAPSVVLQSVVGTVTDGIGAGVKVNLPSKSANQAVKAARASAHAQGKGLPSSEAKATASKARKEIANKKEISAGIQAGTEGLLGTAIGTYVNENL